MQKRPRNRSFIGLPAGSRTRNCALGVLKNSQNPIKISNFRTFLGVLSNIFRLNRLFSFVFSSNFRFQNNFQTKIIPKTIPIFIAVFKKSNAKRHLFFVVVAITADLCYNSNNERQNIIMRKVVYSIKKVRGNSDDKISSLGFLNAEGTLLISIIEQLNL